MDGMPSADTPDRGEEDMRAGRSRWRFSTLLAVLILQILLSPIYRLTGLGPALLWLFVVIVLITGVYAVSDRQWNTVVAAALAVLASVAGAAYLITGDYVAKVAEGAFLVGFYSFTTVVILGRVIRTQRVTRETISAAISVYLLIGFTFAALYQSLDELLPGSFGFSSGAVADQALIYPEYVYYSFITLTTTGTGDIIPLTDIARSFAMLEAVAGTLFIAVLIARLIGIISSNTGNGR
jgi:hypothetical protein